MLKLGGIRIIVAENLAIKQQFITLKRKQKRSPRLFTFDRFIFGLITFLTGKHCVYCYAVIIKSAAILRSHKALVQKKYHDLFSKKTTRKPGPRGPSQELIDAAIDMKQRNPRIGDPRCWERVNKRSL